jgi:glyoxylase-like metal-dependent hydrolase (beta-lactamase superfamily II)
MVPVGPERPRVEKLELSIANAYVVYGRRPILIDTGTAGDGDRVVEALGELGIKKGELALVVLTHGHADHAGAGKRIHDDLGAPIAAGQGDVEMLRNGRNRTLHPMSFTARLLRPFVDRTFPPYTPDIVVTAPIDLRPYGVDGRIIPTPGHTPGSQVVLLDDGDAFVGDLMLGGYLGGAMAASSPGRHYYHDDPIAAEAQICFVIRNGGRRLYIGHGGPIAAEDAWKEFCSSGNGDGIPTTHR